MTRARLAGPLVACAALAMSPARPAHADDPSWGLGLQGGMLGVPAGNLGLPLDDIAGVPFDAPVEIVVRRQFASTRAAVNAGIGFPHIALGLATWLAVESFVPVAGDERSFCALELYADPGVQVGYAGPDYFARHGGAFVGYEYGATGPIALAMRTPVGARVVWRRLRLDTFVEAASMVTLTPDVEPFFTAIAGIRVRL